MKRILAGLALAGAIAAGTATTASAAAAHPFSPNYCGGDVCATWTGSAGSPDIRAWANYGTFYGHFEVQTPGGGVYNSITSTWHAGGYGNNFGTINRGIGTYCVTAWESVGGSYTKIGYTCFSA